MGKCCNIPDYTQMYGPPPNCKRFEVGRKGSPRKCIRPLSGESLSGHSMMIRTCRSFLNPSVTRDAFERSGFPARRWTVLSSPSVSADLWNYSRARRRGGGKVESVVCFPSVASFPRPSSCRWLQRLMSEAPAAGPGGPGDGRQFIRNGHHHLIAG